MQELLLNWKINITENEKITDTAHRINQAYVIKKTISKLDMVKNIGILKALKEISFPVPEVIVTSSGEDYVTVEDAYYMVTEEVKGEHLRVEDVIHDPKQSFKVGQVIAELQNGLKVVEKDFEFYNNDFLKELNGWINKEVEVLGSNYFVTEIFSSYKKEMKEIYPKLIRQPIHRDVHLNNMLFDNGELAGYIDFDISQINVRMFDLAYMAVGVLAEVFDTDLRLQWRNFFDSLVSGYKSISPIELIEEESLWLLMGSIEILFVAYYNKNNNETSARLADDVLKWIWSNK
jgi:Ser/Thr protein kinase RdoA (MazF antagonist)